MAVTRCSVRRMRRCGRPAEIRAADQFGGVEVAQPRPQPDVRLERLLRLQSDEVLDGLDGGHGVAIEQELAGQQRPVQSPTSEHRGHVGETIGSTHGRGGAKMLERDGYPTGVPCWIDTAQPDVDAAPDLTGGCSGGTSRTACRPMPRAATAWRGLHGLDSPWSVPSPKAHRRIRSGAPMCGSTTPTPRRRRSTPPVAPCSSSRSTCSTPGGWPCSRPVGRRLQRLAGRHAPGRPVGQRAGDVELERPHTAASSRPNRSTAAFGWGPTPSTSALASARRT